MFVSKKIIKATTLGDKLLEARQEQNIRLEKAAQDLDIAFKYLEALEKNQLDALPGQSYAQNFLRLYCGYLKLDFNDCLKAANDFKSDRKNSPKLEARYFSSWPKFSRRLFLILAALAVLFFLGFEVRSIFAPPFLEIKEPADGLITSEKQIKVGGSSQPEAEIVINNENVFVDNNGNFQAQVDLQKGLNLIKITAKKKYSRPREAEVRVLLKE